MKFRSLAVTALAATILSVACLVPPSLRAQSYQDFSNTQASSSNISEQQFPASVNPSRTKLTREENGNRIVEKKSVEAMGSPGQYQPYLDITKETVKVDSTTVRTVERVYSRDFDGRKKLVQVTEQESRTLAGSEVTTVRTTSIPDLNGHLSIVQREIENAKSTSPNVRETKTSVLTPDVNGGLTELVRVERRETQSPDHTVQFQQTKRARDISGRWQAREVREGVVTQNGTEQTSEEKVLRPGSDGNLLLVQRTVHKGSASPNGDSRETTETESVDLPGLPLEGRPRPLQRVTSTLHVGKDGSGSKETQLEQPNPGSPASGMRVTSRTIEIVQPGPAGTSQEMTTVRWLDGGGNLTVDWKFAGNSTKPVYDQVNLALRPAAVPAQATTAQAPSQPKQ